jgi:hypothetical protein
VGAAMALPAAVRAWPRKLRRDRKNRRGNADNRERRDRLGMGTDRLAVQSAGAPWDGSVRVVSSEASSGGGLPGGATGGSTDRSSKS